MDIWRDMDLSKYVILILKFIRRSKTNYVLINITMTYGFKLKLNKYVTCMYMLLSQSSYLSKLIYMYHVFD